MKWRSKCPRSLNMWSCVNCPSVSASSTMTSCHRQSEIFVGSYVYEFPASTDKIDHGFPDVYVHHLVTHAYGHDWVICYENGSDQ